MATSASSANVRLWGPAVCWGVLAWGFHKAGALAGYYIAFGWFQNLTHAVSASAMAALIAAAGIHVGYRHRRLVAFVVAGSLVGALSWEFVEFLGLLDAFGIWLHFHSVHDAAIDMAANAVGVSLTLVAIWYWTGLDAPSSVAGVE